MNIQEFKKPLLECNDLESLIVDGQPCTGFAFLVYPSKLDSEVTHYNISDESMSFLYVLVYIFCFHDWKKMASLDVSVRFSYRYSLPNCPRVACQVFIASTILQCSLHRWLLSSETNQNRMVYTMLRTSLKLLHEYIGSASTQISHACSYKTYGNKKGLPIMYR